MSKCLSRLPRIMKGLLYVSGKPPPVFLKDFFAAQAEVGEA
jgi:hypothetical protein